MHIYAHIYIYTYTYIDMCVEREREKRCIQVNFRLAATNHKDLQA